MVKNNNLIILFLSTILLTAIAANAQEEDWISILVNVTTKDQKRIAELNAMNFRASLNRKRIDTLAVRSEMPRRLVLLLDASRSVIRFGINWVYKQIA